MKSDSSLGPRTIVGRWLLATILGHEDQRDQLVTRLNEDESKWKKYDEPAVVEVACWLAVRRLLPTNADETQISALARSMRSKNRSNSVPGQHVMEIIIRAALGHQDVSFDGIGSNILFVTQGFAVGYAYFKLGMERDEIARLITEAEQVAFKQGWNPPLISD
jgi:hypothetical protein